VRSIVRRSPSISSVGLVTIIYTVPAAPREFCYSNIYENHADRHSAAAVSMPTCSTLHFPSSTEYRASFLILIKSLIKNKCVFEKLLICWCYYVDVCVLDNCASAAFEKSIIRFISIYFFQLRTHRRRRCVNAFNAPATFCVLKDNKIKVKIITLNFFYLFRA
jgi:hypothetical protein